MNKQRSIPLDCMELDFDGVHVRLTVQQFDVLYPYKKKCETTEKERNEMSEKWIAQSIKIEELELFFKVEKETLNKVTKDYIELEKAYEELQRDIDIIKKHGVIKFSNGTMDEDLKKFQRAKQNILK